MTRKQQYPPDKLPVSPHYNIRSDHALRVFADDPTPTTAKHLVEVLRDELLSGRLGSRKASYIFGVLYGYLSRLESERLPKRKPKVTLKGNPTHGTEEPQREPDIQTLRPDARWRAGLDD